jgi:hypothetical protein
MRRGLARLRIAVLSAVLSLGIAGASPAAEADRTYPVGIKQLEFADAHYGPRTLSMAVFYPAVIDTTSAKPFVMPFFTKLALYKDAEIAFDGEKRPLVMLSHGRGSTGLSYAGSRKPSPRTAISLPRPIIGTPTATMRPSPISPTSSGSARSISASTSTFS